MRDLTYQQAFDFMNEIYGYDCFCTDESNVTAQIRTDLELLCMKAILKQIPEPPVHIHEVYPKHDWYRDKNGEIDMWVMDVGYHNGPGCKRCHATFCEHCDPDWDKEECEVDEMRCPSCNEEIGWPYEKNKFCRNCGQAIDWSDL